jgi:hypothetical protein
MRNPWVHDDVATSPGFGYGGRVRLLGATVWGTLLLGVGGTALLVGTGGVDPALGASVRSAVTYVVAGAALVLLSPLLLRLLSVSRLLGAIAFLASGWLLGGFVWSREAERIGRLLPGEWGFEAGSAGLGGAGALFDALLDALLAAL